MHTFRSLNPNKSWTLFLDRDGVINVRPDNDYVKNVSDFVFIEGVIESISSMSAIFGTIVIVTNQQGLGKGLMTLKDLTLIHNHMIKEIENGGGRIDKVYFCGDLKNSGSLFRKPDVGMGLQARRDFPHVQFKQSVMAGDTLTDMIFGKRLNMHTVLIDRSPEIARQYPHLVDSRYPTLKDFAETL